MTGDLTVLADVKSWINPNPATPMQPIDDGLLARLISASSNHIKRWISRDVFMTTYSERYNGLGGTRLTLRNAPVFSITSLVIGSTIVPASPDGITSGYMFEENGTIFLIGYAFPRAMQNIAVSYIAGFFQVDTLAVPTTPFQLAANTLSQPWASALNVSYLSGIKLTQVASAPTVGQYVVSAAGLYTFAAADAGALVNISYGCLPADLTQGCIELVAARYRDRKHIGLKSETLGSQTTSYDMSEIPATVKLYLQQYKKVTSP